MQSADRTGQRQTSIGSSRLQWVAPDFNRELQIAMGSAGPHPGAPDCSGQRRASPTELPSGVGSAGPHPESSRAEWAAPDLPSQKKDARIYVRMNVKRNVRKNIRRYVRRYIRRNIDKNIRKYVRKYFNRYGKKTY